jgi:hypothetical protein
MQTISLESHSFVPVDMKGLPLSWHLRSKWHRVNLESLVNFLTAVVTDAVTAFSQFPFRGIHPGQFSR